MLTELNSTEYKKKSSVICIRLEYAVEEPFHTSRGEKIIWLKVLKPNTKPPILSIYDPSHLYMAQPVPHPLNLPSPECHFSFILATSFRQASGGWVVVSKEGD